MVGESCEFFTKRVLGVKHINGIMCKNPRGPRPFPTPMKPMQQPQYSLTGEKKASI